MNKNEKLYRTLSRDELLIKILLTLEELRDNLTEKKDNKRFEEVKEKILDFATKRELDSWWDCHQEQFQNEFKDESKEKSYEQYNELLSFHICRTNYLNDYENGRLTSDNEDFSGWWKRTKEWKEKNG